MRFGQFPLLLRAPTGTPTQSGTTNPFWPFLYHGVEQEFFDAPYYYAGSGQFYSPQLVRSLSEVGQTSSGGAGGGPAGSAISPPSISTGGLSPQSFLNDSQQALQVGEDIYQTTYRIGLAYGQPEALPLALPLALIGGGIDFLVNFFEDILGGGSSSETPRQLRRGRHPLYPVILGVQNGLIPDEVSAGPKTCGDPHICVTRPLADDKVLEIPQATTTATPTPVPQMTWDQLEREYKYLHEQGRPPWKSSSISREKACQSTSLRWPLWVNFLAALGGDQQFLKGRRRPCRLEPMDDP